MNLKLIFVLTVLVVCSGLAQSKSIKKQNHQQRPKSKSTSI